MSLGVALLIELGIRFLFSWWCVSIAKRKWRGTTTAGILGFFFGLWAVIGYAIVRSKKPNISTNCPICNADTDIRTVKKGKDIGKIFLVCINYPQCKGRIPI